MSAVDLFEIPPGTTGYRKEFEVVPERPFMLPGRGRMELHFTGPATAEVLVYDEDNKLTDRVPATIIPIPKVKLEKDAN